MRFDLGIRALAASVLLVAACAPAPEEAEPTAGKMEMAAADLESINELRDAFIATYNTNNASQLAELYTEDAVWMPPNEPATTGRAAIQAWFQGFFGQHTTAKLSVSPAETKVAGDWAFDRGTYTVEVTPKAGGEPMEMSGKYLVILQRQADGSWKIARDIDNSDSPPPGSSG